MIIFAIESSCDETAAAVIRADGQKIEVLSNIVSSQIAIHALYGGVVPEIASRAHCEAVTNVSRAAITEAGIRMEDINAVAVTFAPGLIGSLLVGVNFAKSFASTLGVPLIPVNHIEAHVSAAYVENEQLKPPYLALVDDGTRPAVLFLRLAVGVVLAADRPERNRHPLADRAHRAHALVLRRGRDGEEDRLPVSHLSRFLHRRQKLV